MNDSYVVPDVALTVRGEMPPRFDEILTPDALDFVAELAREMEEILYELRDHSAGLNAGHWDYIFSMIKNFADDEDHLLPDRSQVTMTSPFMAAYAELLVKTCHARGAHAIGGMAAFVPSKASPDATAAALEKTTADKSREAGAGFDGSWVAHPGLHCVDAFTAVLGDRPNQLERQRDDVTVTGEQLTDVSTTRMQVWQWRHHRAATDDGGEVTDELVRAIMTEELERLAGGADERSRALLDGARDVFASTCSTDDWPQFFTNYAYDRYLVDADA